MLRKEVFVKIIVVFSFVEKQNTLTTSNKNGLNRCMDKGLAGCKRYVGLSVLAYNLHIFGNALKAKEKAEEERRKKQG